MSEPTVFPMQVTQTRNRKPGTVPQVVALRAYEVYKELFGRQEALITGHCRGGFGAGEIIAFLYAYGFPRDEWRKRVDEALNGLNM